MPDINWDDEEETSVPQGQFVGFAEIGQTIIGEVVSYDDDTGSNFDGDPCPLVVLTLTAPAVTFREKGADRRSLDAGELVSITCGQAGLRRKMIAAAPTPGDIVRVEFTGTYKTPKGEGKEFSVKIARRQTPAMRTKGQLFSDD